VKVKIKVLTDHSHLEGTDVKALLKKSHGGNPWYDSENKIFHGEFTQAEIEFILADDIVKGTYEITFKTISPNSHQQQAVTGYLNWMALNYDSVNETAVQEYINSLDVVDSEAIEALEDIKTVA